MKSTLTRERLATAVSAEVGVVCGRRLGDRVSLVPADQWGETGWIATVPVAGRGVGSVTVWIDREGLAAISAAAPDATGTPDAEFVAALVAEAVDGLRTQPAFSTLAFGPVSVSGAHTEGRAPLLAVQLTGTAGVRCHVAVGAELVLQSDPDDLRLESVLEFDLPLVVRFGRAVMPLKALASLGPGAMIDLGRSPDQPVELVVGERVIALGEVVVVNGNYGVRVTELTGAHRATSQAIGGGLS